MCRAGIAATAVALSFLSTSCTQIPELNGVANVPLGDVVKRIKCDLFQAVLSKAREDRDRYGFLLRWSAKVHLTLIVDNTATINPGATIINPLKRAGTSFSLGLGAGLITEAVRTEDIEFFLAFDQVTTELGNEDTYAEKYNACRFENGILLQSDLDLKSILNKALEPVKDGTLSKGPNVPTGSGAPPTIPPDEATKIDETLEKLKNVKIPEDKIRNLVIVKRNNPLSVPFYEDLEKTDAGKVSALEIASNITAAATMEADAVSAVKNIASPLYDVAAASLKDKECLPEITKVRFKVLTYGAMVSINKVAVDQATTPETSRDALKEAEKALKSTMTNTQEMLRLILDCAEEAKKEEEKKEEQERQKLGQQGQKPGQESQKPGQQGKQGKKAKSRKEPAYDPIGLISQTINFYITASGSVTPTWKLVRMTAPVSPTFASVSRKDTNTLIIAMGRPDLKNGQAAGASEQMNAAVLYSVLNQALGNRTPLPAN